MKKNVLHQWVLVFGGLLFTASVQAQNPLIMDQFTADPTARVFEGKIYVYPSHDIIPPADARQDWFCMEDYHVFSSENLMDWTDHGMIVSQTTAPWVDASTYSMWAPDCVEKDGKYYFYFPARAKAGGFTIGVAVSDTPHGPFTPEPTPIEGINGIDPCVLIDSDGQAYIYYSMGRIFVAKLKDNMLELDSEPQVIDNLPTEGLIEGPFVLKRDDIYYLTYPHVENETERLEYATGKSPMGPFTPRGVIKDESPSGCWTVHHSILEYKGQWYLFYHDQDLSPQDDKRRAIRADRLYFEDNGDIRKVIPSLRGVGIADVKFELQIDRYSEISEAGTSVSFLDPENTHAGWKVALEEEDAWVRFNQVDFKTAPEKSVHVRAISPQGGAIEIRMDEQDGPLIARVELEEESDWKVVSATLDSVPSGIHDLFIIQKSDQPAEIDWIRFGAGADETAKDARGKMTPWQKGAWETGKYRNLFLEAGYEQEAIDAKLNKAYSDLFESEGPTQIYFEVGDDMAYVSDVKNRDARTEGLSYGLMVAVQLDKKEVFDKLWRWTVKNMQHQEGPREAYFAWSVRPEAGRPNSAGSASDGEFYFVTALLFASNRWGNDTGIDYYGEARRILDAMWAKDGTGGVMNVINVEQKMITFTPDRGGYNYTDPSYHVPAFYEIWAEYANDGYEDFYRECAEVSREFLHRACHPETGLTPDYSQFSGEPLENGRMASFGFDSWRVPMNIAMDYSWYAKDKEWQTEYINRLHNFLYEQGVDSFVDQFEPDGSPRARPMRAPGYNGVRHSLGWVSTTASGALMSTQGKGWEFVDEIWNARLEPYEDGYFDPYYDGFLYLFSLMHLSGNYQIVKPEQ